MLEGEMRLRVVTRALMGWRGDCRIKEIKLIIKSHKKEIVTVQIVDLIDLIEKTLLWNQSWQDSDMAPDK